MDPISAVASIVGLVGAAAKISETLFKFISSVKGAPKLASSVLQEVSDTSACLSQLQSCLMGTKTTSRSHENLLMVEQIVLALSNCVVIFSEFEEIVESLRPSDPMQSGRLGLWILKERAIKDLFTRLHNSKASLNLMMTVLTCASVDEAQTSVAELATLVTQILESNQEISRRMARLEQQNFGRPPSTVPTITKRILGSSIAETDTEDDIDSIVTIRGSATDLQNVSNRDSRRIFGFSFDQILNASRPYTRAMKRATVSSTTSSEIHTMGWSCLSGLSLAEVSHISVINLPFCPQDLWNGHHYSATRIDPVGFVLSKSHNNSVSSLTAQPATTLGSDRPKTKVFFRAGQKGGNLSTINEDKGLLVPAATRTVSLLGGSLAGKTTIFNHLQILYGNGITRLARFAAFKDIIGNLIDVTFRALSVSGQSEYYGQDGYETDRKHFFTLVRAMDDYDRFLKGMDDGSCQWALRHFWNNEEVRDTILNWSGRVIDENVSYYIENMEQLLARNKVVSDAMFLRANRRRLDIDEQSIDIDHTHYRILNPTSHTGYTSHTKWDHCFRDIINANVVIFVVSLISYYKISYYRFPYEDTQKNDMMRSLETFAALTKEKSLKSTPFIVLLNKYDLFEEKLTLKPIRDHFPLYSGSPDPSLACGYFASRFLELDKRPNASLRIYKTSAVDRDSFKATMDGMAQWMA